MADTLIFNLARRLKRRWSREAMAALTQAEVDEINAVLADWKRGQGAATTPRPTLGISTPAAPVSAADAPLTPSPAAFAIIREFEGYHKALPGGRVEAYPDPASGGDPWTIGFGSTGPDVKRGTIWTREMAIARMERDVASFAAGVARRIGDAATAQHEFDAMTSLAYNVGLGNFEKSTLLRKHKAGDKVGAAAEFPRWNRAAGKVMAGLTRRRAAERKLYEGGA